MAEVKLIAISIGERTAKGFGVYFESQSRSQIPARVHKILYWRSLWCLYSARGSSARFGTLRKLL